jgi:hypothetical protein
VNNSVPHLETLTRSLIVLLLISPAGCNSGKEGQPQADAPAAPEANNSVVAAPDISIIDAAVAGNVAAIKQHIESGTNIDQKEPLAGGTPLIVASVLGHTEVARELIEAGADIEAKNNEQTTPLYNAAFFCHPETVELLLKHGANVNTTDKNGTSLIELMELPWNTAKGIYQIVYPLLGLELDDEKIQATRPVIAEMLNQHTDNE